MNPTASIGASVRRQSRADVRHLQSVLDTRTAAVQNGVAVFNQAASPEKLEQIGKQSVQSPDVNGVSVLAIPEAFTNGGQGQRRRIAPTGYDLPVSQPLPFVRRPVPENMGAAVTKTDQIVKADSMKSTASVGASVRRQSRAVRKGFTRPLFVRPVRTFPTFEQASRFVAVRLGSRAVHRLAVQQTAQGSWAVCRVLQGGV